MRHLDDFERVLQQDGNERGVYALADGFLGGRRVRLGQHASRRTCADTDLFACCQGYLTEWIFQCPDLRFRVHEASWPRLRFLLACWAHYAEPGVAPASGAFGPDAFPLGSDLRPDIADPPGRPASCQSLPSPLRFPP